MKDGFSVLTREGAFEQGLFYVSRRTAGRERLIRTRLIRSST